MIAITSLILFFSFYTFYYTSKRAVLSYHLSFEKWMQKNQKQTKALGCLLLFTAYILWVLTTALGAGTLIFFIEIMTLGSLIIILKPLESISLKAVILLYVIIQIIEFYYS